MNLQILYSWKEMIGMVMPLIVFFIILIFGFALRKFLFSRMLRWAANTKTQLDDIVIAATSGPFIIWCVMFGIYFALKTSALSPEAIRITGKILLVLGIASVTFALSHISTEFIKVHSGKIKSALPVTSLTQNIARIAIFVTGTLVALNSLGISVTPILATLGVGGLAVALALQDTLSNFFAGFHIVAGKQVSVGDYVKLGSGEEGYIVDINWRITKIKMLSDNIILVPNTKMTQSVITNYCLPAKEMVVTIEAGVHYSSDLEKVERVTSEVAKEVINSLPGGVAGFEPFIQFHSFGDSAVKFMVILRVREFADQGRIKHAFIKRLHQRYRKEGIVMPYPVMAINYQQEKEG